MIKKKAKENSPIIIWIKMPEKIFRLDKKQNSAISHIQTIHKTKIFRRFPDKKQ